MGNAVKSSTKVEMKNFPKLSFSENALELNIYKVFFSSSNFFPLVQSSKEKCYVENSFVKRSDEESISIPLCTAKWQPAEKKVLKLFLSSSNAVKMDCATVMGRKSVKCLCIFIGYPWEWICSFQTMESINLSSFSNVFDSECIKNWREMT